MKISGLDRKECTDLVQILTREFRTFSTSNNIAEKARYLVPKTVSFSENLFKVFTLVLC